jgi:hypothetical protein
VDRDYSSSTTVGSSLARKSKTDQSIEVSSRSVNSLSVRIDALTTMQEAITKLMIETRQNTQRVNNITNTHQIENCTENATQLHFRQNRVGRTEGDKPSNDDVSSNLLNLSPGAETPGGK